MLLVGAGASWAQTSGDGSYGNNISAPTPAGHTERFVVPFYTSQTLKAGVRSATVISVFNENNVACDVGVQFQFMTGPPNTCLIALSIPPKQSRRFCSRAINDPIMPCTVSCALTFNTGAAFVSSTKTGLVPGCNLIAVDAQLIQTRDAGDDLVESVSKLSVQKKSGTAGQ